MVTMASLTYLSAAGAAEAAGAGEAAGLLGLTLVTEKVITLFTMAAVTFLCGMLPLKLFSQLRNNPDVSSRIRWRLVISFSSCFAGGVFIAACLLDLLPDVEESFEKVLEEIKHQYNVDLDYPVAQFVIVFGFFIILTIEQAVLHFQEQWAMEAEREPLLSRRRRPSTGSYSSIGDPGHHHGRGGEGSVRGVSNEVHHSDDGHRHHDHQDDHHGHGAFQHSSLRSVMLLLALSFHSVFEGLAIGLQPSAHQMLTVFAAVIIHKAVMAFSLGLNIAQSQLSVRAFVWSNVLFSVSSPVGVAIGIGLSDLPETLAPMICNGVLQGIAGGTFLYITFFEVLPHELNVPSKRMWKVLFVVLGYASICLILFIAH